MPRELQSLLSKGKTQRVRKMISNRYVVFVNGRETLSRRGKELLAKVREYEEGKGSGIV